MIPKNDQKTNGSVAIQDFFRRQVKAGKLATDGVRAMIKELKELELNELYRLSAKIDEDPDRIADLLFPENPPGSDTVVRKIGQWAMNQTAVLESNLNNRPDVAFIFHKVGERIWQQLPSFAQHARINVLKMDGSRIGATAG
jgi:hypothetical protein